MEYKKGFLRKGSYQEWLQGFLFVSVTDAATYYKITVPAIINAIKGYNGYKNKMQWRYLTDEEIANLKVKTSKP